MIDASKNYGHDIEKVGDPRIVYSAYHAVFQIYQKEVGVIVNYVKLLNERLNFCRIVDC